MKTKVPREQSDRLTGPSSPTSVRPLIARRPEILLTPLVLFVVLGLWQLIATLELVSPILLPRPAVVFDAFIFLITAPFFPKHIVATTIETILGFVIGSTLAIATASLLHHFPLARRVLYPYILTFQLTPSIVLAPIFIIWFGLGMQSKVVTSVTTAFFVVLITSLRGFESVDENARLLMRSLSSSRLRTFRMLTFPTALPYIFAGLQTATAMALIGALVGEFITSDRGLGALLTQFGFQLRQDLVFATIIVIVSLGLVLFGTVNLLFRWIVWWHPGARK